MNIVGDYKALQERNSKFTGHGQYLVLVTETKGIVLTEEEKRQAIEQEMEDIFANGKQDSVFVPGEAATKLIEFEVLEIGTGLGEEKVSHVVARANAVNLLGSFGANKIGIISDSAVLFKKYVD